MDGTAQLLWGVLFGGAGLGFFLYGRKQKAAIPFISGVGLLVFPYFVSNLYVLIAVGIFLMALPTLVKLEF